MATALLDDFLARWEALGGQGVITSIAFGPVVGFSVMCAFGTSEFDQPIAAASFAHAVVIAEQECERRGWLSKGAIA